MGLPLWFNRLFLQPFPTALPQTIPLLFCRARAWFPTPRRFCRAPKRWGLIANSGWYLHVFERHDARRRGEGGCFGRFRHCCNGYPEGYKLSDIAAAVDAATGGRVSADEFTNAASRCERVCFRLRFLGRCGHEFARRGFLFPKTYSVSETDTADSLIRAMLNQFRTETAGLIGRMRKAAAFRFTMR